MPNDYDYFIERALRAVQNLLRANVAPTGHLTDDRTAGGIRAIVGGPELGRSLERANDTALCFALREIRRVLSDKLPPEALVMRLGAIMDGPEINPARRIEQKPPRMLKAEHGRKSGFSCLIS